MEGTMKGEDDSDNLIGVLLSMNHWFRKVYKPNENPKSRTQTQLSRTKKEVFQESTINNPDLKKIIILLLIFGILVGIIYMYIIIPMQKVSKWKLGVAYCYLFLCAPPPPPHASSPQVRLNSTINDGDTVCPGQVITFTCETKGSEVLAWMSDDYIGEGSRLEFANFSNFNLIHVGAIPGTVAVLIKNTIVDETIVLVSQLTIKVPDSEISSNPSISCVHIRDNTRQTINFRYLNFAKPEMQQDMILVEQRRHTVTVSMSTCILSLTWNSPVNEYLSGYIVNVDGENIVNKTDNLNATLNYFSLPLHCGTHNVSLRAFDICGRVSNSTPVIIVAPEEFPFSLITPADLTVSKCSESTTQDALLSILGVLLCMIIIVFGIVIAVLAIALWSTWSKYKHTFK